MAKYFCSTSIYLDRYYRGIKTWDSIHGSTCRAGSTEDLKHEIPSIAVHVGAGSTEDLKHEIPSIAEHVGQVVLRI